MLFILSSLNYILVSLSLNQYDNVTMMIAMFITMSFREFINFPRLFLTQYRLNLTTSRVSLMTGIKLTGC